MDTDPGARAPDHDDLHGLASNLRRLFELAAHTLADDARRSELSVRVTNHLGCEFPDVVPVTERFPVWEHVNVQRGVDAYLARHGAGQPWFGLVGAGRRPHEDLLAMIAMSGHFGSSRAGAPSFGTAPVGPEENTEVVTLGLIPAFAPDGAPVVIGIRAAHEFGPPRAPTVPRL